MESGKNSGRGGEKGRHGVRFTGIFLNDCWKNKEVVRIFKGTKRMAECLIWLASLWKCRRNSRTMTKFPLFFYSPNNQ